ncbi:MAG: zosA [Verrucomicrobiales bacterium]|nr:zosA [Verrucomicrobiales bacterium]
MIKSKGPSIPLDKREDCLLKSVAAAVTTNPSLEAVTIDEKNHKISVATLGARDQKEAEQKILDIVQADKPGGSTSCGLMTGDGDCGDCSVDRFEFSTSAVKITRSAGTTTISKITCPTSPRFWHWKNLPWPTLSPREFEGFEHDHEHHAEGEWKWQLGAASLCGAAALISHFLLHGTMQTAGFLLAYICGSWFAAKEVFELLQKSKLDVHFLMLSVAFGSAAIGAWDEGATLLFLFSISGALEHYALGRTYGEIQSLFKSAPREAIVVDAGTEKMMLVESLSPGMILRIRPDSQYPVDAEVISGKSAADESNLTGEATPVEKQVGDSVLAGTLNLWGTLDARVVKSVQESSLHKIIQLIEDANRFKAPAQRLTDKFGTTYTYGILGLSGIMFLVWWLGYQLPPIHSTLETQSAFYKAMTLLVVASPCALVLSIPSAVLAAIAWGAKRGILFRGGAAVEKLAEISVVAMDKTGTLTTGNLQISKVESFPPGNEANVLEESYALENLSNHPLARAISTHAKKHGTRISPALNFESISGMGLLGKVNGHQIAVGKRNWAQGIFSTVEFPPDERSSMGISEVWFAREDGVMGRIQLQDEFRMESKNVVSQLRKWGLLVVVLTGDRHESAEALKNHLKLPDVRSELTPDQKLFIIRELSRNGKVAMIGDGVNDAPSLAAAHVGVAMGARGSDAALEQAEVVLMHDKLENFCQALQLSKAAKKVIQQNLVISLGTVAVLVTFAILGKIPLTLGVVGHEGSTVIVVMNSLRLLLRKAPAYKNG